jgi:hypothetical protein
VDESADKSLDDLTSVEQIETHRGARELHSRGLQRRKRLLIGLVVSILVAGGGGFWIGLRSHRSAQELAEEQRAQAEAEFNLKRESNRLINELWKMEDLERAGR